MRGGLVPSSLYPLHYAGVQDWIMSSDQAEVSKGQLGIIESTPQLDCGIPPEGAGTGSHAGTIQGEVR